jgi:methylenetetrahydrofolate dehydrogenase (NADP+) / methenyltetrahydrofolate cyclohydrolase
MTRRLEGKPVAEALASELRQRRQEGEKKGWPTPCLASIHIGEKTPFAVYLQRQRREAERFGIALRSTGLGEAATQEELERTVQTVEEDGSVDAVLLQHPLPPPLDFFSAVGRVRPTKDVDGVSATSVGRLAQDRPLQVPAVARAALAICRHYRIDLSGEPVAVLGRSQTVGVPLALLLLAKRAGADATVTVAHSRTRSLGDSLLDAHVIFSCVGSPGLLGRANVPKDAIVIDVGLTTIPDSTRPSGVRMAGDASPDLEGWAEALTPVPGGVGPVTVAQLMTNVLRSWAWGHGGEA